MNKSILVSSLHLASAHWAEVPRLHHGKVGEIAVHSVWREAVCALVDMGVSCMREHIVHIMECVGPCLRFSFIAASWTPLHLCSKHA